MSKPHGIWIQKLVSLAMCVFNLSVNLAKDLKGQNYSFNK